MLAIGAVQDRILNSLQTRALTDSIPGPRIRKSIPDIFFFERVDEFITLATEFLFREHD